MQTRHFPAPLARFGAQFLGNRLAPSPGESGRRMDASPSEAFDDVGILDDSR